MYGIKKAMQEKRVTIEAVSNLLGIHRNSAASKVNGETAFSVAEAIRLRQNLFAEYTMEYLFCDIGQDAS